MKNYVCSRKILFQYFCGAAITCWYLTTLYIIKHSYKIYQNWRSCFKRFLPVLGCRFVKVWSVYRTPQHNLDINCIKYEKTSKLDKVKYTASSTAYNVMLKLRKVIIFGCLQLCSRSRKLITIKMLVVRNFFFFNLFINHSQTNFFIEEYNIFKLHSPNLAKYN